MILPLNADLIRRDPKLSGLAILLNPQAFGNLLREAHPEAGFGDVQPTYIRYKPGKSCLVSYQVDRQGTLVDVYAKCFKDPHKIKRARERAGVVESFGPKMIALDEQGIFICISPSDNKLGSLCRLMNPETRKSLLAELLPDRPDLWEDAGHRLRYKPERRYVFRLGSANNPQAAVKFYTPDEYQNARFKAEAIQSKENLRVPKLLGFSDTDFALAFEWLEGMSLDKIMMGDLDQASQVVEETGFCLAELHKQKIPGMDQRNWKAESQELIGLAERFGFLCPDSAQIAMRLAKSLAMWLEKQPPGQGLIHGDFYDRQILVHQDEIRMVDFDEALLGDPREDLGLFIAHMERDGEQRKLPNNHVEPLTRALLKGYARNSGQSQTADLKMYIALGLFRLTPHAFRHFDPQWDERIEWILERVKTLMRNHYLSA